jgi:hypothetical protein
MKLFSSPAFALLAVCIVATGCGGGASGSCERISNGSSSIEVHNELSSGLEVYFPQFAFSSDMFPGKCDIVGLEYSADTLAVQVQLRQCNNSKSDSDCAGNYFGATKTRTIQLNRGDTVLLIIDASVFR